MFACVLIVGMLSVSAALAGETSLGSLPATFLGTLPCADCAGIRVQINLLPDGAYTLRRTYFRDGRDESVYEIGAWVLNDRTLALNGGDEARAYWSVLDPRTLRARDRDGREIESRLPSDLTRCAEILPMEARARLRGLFRETPGGARFSDCLSGLQWPVSTEGDYADLEDAYRGRSSKKKANPDLLVTVDARIDATRAINGHGEPMLVVERFVRATPGAICMETPERMALADTRWRPIVVRGQPVRIGEPRRTPWIELDSQSQRFTGSAGCNRIAGGWRGSGDRLRFSGITTTRMACPRMDVEEVFLDALEHTRGYRFSGRTLELLGQDGALLARLEES